MARLLALIGCIIGALAQPDVAHATDGTIDGVVVYDDSGVPAAGVRLTIVVSTSTMPVVTGDDGSFRLDGLPYGSATIEVDHPGFAWLRREVDVKPSRRLRVEIRLIEDTGSVPPIEIIGRSALVQRGLVGTATRLDASVAELIQPTGTQELLEAVPGIHGFADDGAGNSRMSVGIRGLNPRRSSRVLVLEDGVPIQPAVYVYANMYYNPPAERLDGIEIIKGSAALEHGPQTMGGVINYVTRRPREAPGGSARVTGGSNGLASLLLEYGGWGSERLQPELQLLFKRGDGFRDNNAFTQWNGTFKLEADFGDERALYVKANANREESEATYTGLTEYSFRTDPRFNPKEDDLFEVTRFALDLVYSNRLTQRTTQNTVAYLSAFERTWWRENDVFVDADTFDGETIVPVSPFEPGDLIRTGGGVDNFGILRTFYNLGVEHAYHIDHQRFGLAGRSSFGARLHWERFEDDRKVGDAPDARDGVYFRGDPSNPDSLEIVGQSQHYETTALAAYWAEEIRAGDWILKPGLRLELFEQTRVDRLAGSVLDDRTTGVLLPGFGFNRALDTWNVFGGVHRGYTPPSSGTLTVVDFGQAVDDGGLDVEAETSWNSEIGARGRWGGDFVEAAYFQVDVRDLVAAGRGTAFRNLGRVRTRGVELSATVDGERWHPWLPACDVAYTYLDTEIQSGRIVSAVLPGAPEVSIAGNELPYAPRHTLSAALRRSFADRIDARFGMRFTDDVFTDFENITTTSNRGDTGPVPDYVVFDASAHMRVRPTTELFVTAKNLFDEVYIGSRLHSNPRQTSATASSGILVGGRRQVNVGLRWSS